MLGMVFVEQSRVVGMEGIVQFELIAFGFDLFMPSDPLENRFNRVVSVTSTHCLTNVEFDLCVNMGICFVKLSEFRIPLIRWRGVVDVPTCVGITER